MKALILAATAIGACCLETFAADLDFFGLPITPKSATPKPATSGTTASRPAVGETPSPAIKSGPLTPADEIAAVVQRFKDATARQDAEEAKLVAPAFAAYIRELEKLRDASEAKGDLDAVLEANAALKAVQAGEPAPPGKVLASALAQAQANFERIRESAVHPYASVRARLNAEYDRAIADLVQKFTRAGNLDAVQAAREAVRSALTVDAHVDGPSTFFIHKDGLWCVNGGNAKPDQVFVDGKKWEARWGKPDQPRGADKTNTYPLTLPTLDLKIELVSVTERQGEKGMDDRTPIDIKHHGNEIQIVIPDPEPGARWYKLVFREK